MTKKTTKEMIEVMQAFEDGKVIECEVEKSVWGETSEPAWDWGHFDYRVKKEPKYRPFKDTDELIEEYCKRFEVGWGYNLPSIWVKSKKSCDRFLITGFGSDKIILIKGEVSLDTMFEYDTFLDGSPFGKLEE